MQPQPAVMNPASQLQAAASLIGHGQHPHISTTTSQQSMARSQADTVRSNNPLAALMALQQQPHMVQSMQANQMPAGNSQNMLLAQLLNGVSRTAES